MSASIEPVKCVILCAGAGVGGMERVVQTLARQFSLRHVSNRVVLPLDARALETAAWLKQSGVAAVITPQLRHAFWPRDHESSRQLTAFLRENPSDVVNLHYCLNSIPLRDVLAVRRAGRRCVVSLHLGRALDPILQAREIRETQRAAALCDAIIVISGFQRQFLVAAGVAVGRIHLVPGGVSLPRRPPLRQEARRRLGLPPEAFLVATAARLVVPKGVADLIEGLARVPPPTASLGLIVAGDGPERAALEALAKEKLRGRVWFLGHLDEMEDFYAAADVFALASYGESFGLVFAEAAGYGLPSIGTDVGGVPEVVLQGRTGILVPPRDPDRIAAAVRFFKDDPLARELMGEAARERALAQFDEGLMADRYLRLLLPESLPSGLQPLDPVNLVNII